MNANDAHPVVECSNKGTCDRSSGECVCFPNYDGIACERSICPNKCSDAGVCFTQVSSYCSSSNYSSYIPVLSIFHFDTIIIFFFIIIFFNIFIIFFIISSSSSSSHHLLHHLLLLLVEIPPPHRIYLSTQSVLQSSLSSWSSHHLCHINSYFSITHLHSTAPMYLFTYLSFYLSTYLPIYHIYLSICLSIYHIYLYINIESTCYWSWTCV